MATVSLYNIQGEKNGTIDLNDRVFGVKPKVSLIHQVYEALRANAREPWADTKNRGEVRGGGKKPWKQKGTGRARHGSIRSPIWRGGGITFGPLSIRNYKQKVNQKMKQQAVRMCLTDKAMTEQLVVVEGVAKDGKTKSMATLRKKLPGAGRKTLVIVPGGDEMVLRATRNIPTVSTMRAADVSVVDLLNHQYVVATKEAISLLEKRLAPKA